MKNIIIVFSCMLIVNASCKKSSAPVVSPGIYTGTFKRLDVSHLSDVAIVTLHFSGSNVHGNWSGTSNKAAQYYPALCYGTYNMKGSDMIHFENGCMWTANFDGTLILNGDYNISYKGDSLEIRKDYPADGVDIYMLKRN